MKSIESTRMPLGEHLAELRTRLFRVVVSVFVLAGLGFAVARPLFGLLMRPVLRALPPGSGALVYTSAIEEINVYLKVGLYAGLCLSTPVILWQLWAFVAPGLRDEERRLAGPFVLGGTLSFLAGTAFCYFAMLPPMFSFLLRDTRDLEQVERLGTARLREQVALGALGRGDGPGALAESSAALERLAPQGGAQITLDLVTSVGVRPPDEALETLGWLEGLGRLIDAAAPAARPQELDAALAQRAAAIAAWGDREFDAARAACERSAALLAESRPEMAGAVLGLWGLERSLGTTHSAQEAARWTRPMLSMYQQLDLVLLLLLSTGAVFELPLVLALLGMVGVVQSSWLMRYQRHAVVACVLVSALITPTSDVVNLAIMAAPILACYELGVLLVWLIERRRARRERAAAA